MLHRDWLLSATFDSMTGNLVPKVLTDKNGVQTTRWVKPEQKISKLAAVPMPVMSPQQLRVSRLGSLYKAFEEHAQTIASDDITDVDSLCKFVRHLEDATLPIVVDFIYDDDGYSRYGRILDLDDCLTQYNDGAHLRELLTYRGVFDDLDVHRISDMVQSLHRCTELPPMDDYSEADKKTREQIVELLQSAVFVSSRTFPEGSRAVLGRDAQNLLETHPDREAVIKVMADRNTEDVALISSILSSEAPAVSDGIL